VRQVRAGGPTLVIEGGNALFEPETPLADPQHAQDVADGIAAAAARMPVDVWVPGRGDLALGLDFYRALMQRHGIPVVAANLHRRDGSLPFASHVVRELGGVRIVVVGLVGRGWPAASGLVQRDPAAAALDLARRAVAPGDMLVLVAQLSLDEAKQLAQRVPRANAILVADPKSFTFQPSEVVRDRRRPTETTLPLVAAGRRGAHLLRFDLLVRPGDPVWRSDAVDAGCSNATCYRFQFVDVDGSIAEDVATTAWRATLPAAQAAAQTLPRPP